ncbi:MAG: efflux RND transporter periplasmic adaptor subunit, partial [Parachlamydiaceae bacterium]
MHLRNLLIGLALFGIISCLVLIRMIAYTQPAPPPPENPAVNPYPRSIAASGIVEALEENVMLGAPSAGLVTKIYVKVSDKVKTGDPLFKLDSRELDADLLVQKADVEVQRATLNRLKDQLNRLEAVKDPRAISVDEVKTRRNDVHVAETQLARTIEQTKKTEALIERLTIRAPRDGVILQVNLREGEYVQPNQTGIVLGN